MSCIIQKWKRVCGQKWKRLKRLCNGGGEEIWTLDQGGGGDGDATGSDRDFAIVVDTDTRLDPPDERPPRVSKWDG
jgi:hypothetical protein